MKRKKRERPLYGLTEHEVDNLARYNSEILRGIIMHTPEYDQDMAELQARFDQGRLAEAMSSGAIVYPDNTTDEET